MDRRQIFDEPKKATKVDIQQEYDGYINAKKLHKQMRDKGFKVTLKEIQEVIKGDEVNQLYREVGKMKSEYSPIISPTKLHSVQMDLVDMRSLNAKANGGYQYLMTAIDVWSRYTVAVPVKSKSTVSTIAGFKEVLQRLGTMKNLTTDEESAFKSAQFKSLYRQKDIKHWPTPPARKRAVMLVERFHRTLRGLVAKRMKREDTGSWVDVMQAAVSTYNSQPHEGIGDISPRSVWDGDKKPNYEDVEQHVRKDLKVGDTVRYQRELGMFEKKSMAEKWSRQTYAVVKIAGKNYTIKSKGGDVLTKKGYELLKVPADAGDTFVQPTTAEKKQQKATDKRRVARQLQKEGLYQKGDTAVDTRLGRGATRAAAPRRSGRLRGVK